MQSRLKDIRRLSRAGSNLNFEHALAAYGVAEAPRSQSRSVDNDSESSTTSYAGNERQPQTPAQPRDIQRMRSAPRLRSETSPTARLLMPLPEQMPVAPLRVPARSSPASSVNSPSEGAPSRELRSVRPGSIAESQKYRRSPAPSVDTQRIHSRNESLLKLSGEHGSEKGNSTSSVGHW
jgi:hypothetical protein